MGLTEPKETTVTTTYPTNLIDQANPAMFNLFCGTVQEWQNRLSRWLDIAQRKVNDNYAAQFPGLVPSMLEMSMGRRYIRVDEIRDGGAGNRRVWAFIDTRTGDILKPATYRAPAKHARGNLFDPTFGTDRLTPYGPEYL